MGQKYVRLSYVTLSGQGRPMMERWKQASDGTAKNYQSPNRWSCHRFVLVSTLCLKTHDSAARAVNLSSSRAWRANYEYYGWRAFTILGLRFRMANTIIEPRSKLYEPGRLSGNTILFKTAMLTSESGRLRQMTTISRGSGHLVEIETL